MMIKFQTMALFMFLVVNFEGTWCLKSIQSLGFLGLDMTDIGEVSDPIPVEGCPSKIATTNGGKIVAGSVYPLQGNDLPQLSCNGHPTFWYAETKYSVPSPNLYGIGSVIINPGCTLIVFTNRNYGGHYQEFVGPATIPNPPKKLPIYNCDKPCILSFLWTCKQIYPSCTPSDKWQIVTELDNSMQSNDVDFTYKKTVGTEWSQSMTKSKSVSTAVSASISASFWGITATLGVSKTTGYDWKTTDTSTKSETQSYKVSVKVPHTTKVLIEEALGICGDTKIHTQMFRVRDSNTDKILQTYKGNVASHDLTNSG